MFRLVLISAIVLYITSAYLKQNGKPKLKGKHNKKPKTLITVKLIDKLFDDDDEEKEEKQTK